MTSSFPRRSDVHAHAVVLAMCLVALAVVSVGVPGRVDRFGRLKGPDFIQFYTSASMVVDGLDSTLYDEAAFNERANLLVPESRNHFYFPVYGPQVALFFTPVVGLSYGWALTVWLLISAAVYAACCAAVWTMCPALRPERGMVILLAAAFPAFFNVLVHGQNSAVAMACFTVALLALARNRPFIAGLAIGSLVYKPQLGIAAACVFLVNGEWRLVTGAIVATVAQLGTAWLAFGPDVMGAYWRMLRRLDEINALLEIKPYQMHSLSSFWDLLVPSAPIAFLAYLLTAGVALAAVTWFWRTAAPLSLRFACLLLATVLVSPHLYVYDLVIVGPAFMLITDWGFQHPSSPLVKRLERLVYFSYALPLAGALTSFSRVQVSVLAMVALMATLLLTIRHASTNPAVSRKARQAS